MSGSYTPQRPTNYAHPTRELEARDAMHLSELSALVTEILGTFASPLLRATWAWILAPRRTGR